MVAEAETKPRKVGERGPTISVLAKVKARNLYLNQGLSVSATAKEVGLAESTVRKWVERDGWRTERQTSYSRLVAKTDAGAAQTMDAVAKAIASESEELALRGLTKAREEVESGGEFAARNFQSWSGGVKNFVQVAKLVRDPSAIAGDGTRLEMNLFFMQAPRLQTEKQADKVSEPIDVK